MLVNRTVEMHNQFWTFAGKKVVVFLSCSSCYIKECWFVHITPGMSVIRMKLPCHLKMQFFITLIMSSSTSEALTREAEQVYHDWGFLIFAASGKHWKYCYFSAVCCTVMVAHCVWASYCIFCPVYLYWPTQYSDFTVLRKKLFSFIQMHTLYLNLSMKFNGKLIFFSTSHLLPLVTPEGIGHLCTDQT